MRDFWLDEEQTASQEGLCSMALVLKEVVYFLKVLER